MFALLSVSNFSSSVCVCTGIDGLYSKVCGIYGLSPSKYFPVCLREREKDEAALTRSTSEM